MRITREQMLAWLGSDVTMDMLVSMLVDIANGEYEPDALQMDVNCYEGEKQMKNPIPTTGFVATPDSLEDLMEYCERFSGSEKAIAMLVATMALNLAHKMFNEATQGETA